ncbi:VOC family protein [Parerythrobacter jejuensis]|uniref:VOC domain-containing protein n=1 Tax=Parerythrobacter jejuensis TaxID=795812 RepID=A0A845AJ02_9SPHN|nr:VOC family protein [Parerythrobacter jejuensis]MXP30240.1 hypothetical protein [Parerythrobacter jejuensis]MXP33000.1 hypothetical protein [Parerythrobacter jejuensis]
MADLAGLPVRQLAYFVPDIEAAARVHADQFGSGPFFIARHIELSTSEHRGVPQPLDHSSAYGQWGAVMVEFVQQHNSDPSAFHDLFPLGTGRYGLHHMALFVADLPAAIAEFAENGQDLAQYAVTTSGVAYAFIDARVSMGHMLELYEPTEGLLAFYDMVAQAAQGWDGSDPVRELGGY